MSTTIMEFMSRSSGSFPDIFKGSIGSSVELPPERLVGGQQKVICTPEVSLYQYNGGGGIPGQLPSPRMTLEEKGGLDLPSNGTGFQCGVCGKTFQQKNTFQNHLRSHREGDDPYQCDICGKTFAVPARLTRHYRTHTGEKPYQCEYCNKSFSVKENLSVHRRIHTKERPYKCEVCERAFEHSGKLHRHMRIHTGERPHRCQICQKTFIQSGQLVIHMRTHTGEKPYVCKVCNKGFTCSKQLKVHTRTHTGEKPYTCDICGKSFGYNHVLKLHQVAHYGEKVYKCTLCNTTFNSKKALETHIKTHSSDPTSSAPTAADVAHLIPEPRSLSPSLISHAPQHSDKENRESSDSEVSSQNSPTTEAPRSPPSPIYTNSPPSLHHFKSAGITGYSSGANGGSGKSNSTGASLSLLPNIPYPMLPPGVQVHQAPQSRTTYLYVTSKLPPHPTLIGNSSSSPSGSVTEQSVRNPSFKGFGHGISKTSSDSSATRDRDTIFHQTASVRDKVLASLEKFGYGINTFSGGSDNSNSSTNSMDVSYRPKGIQITPVTNPSAAYYNFGRTKHDLTMGRNLVSSRESEGPENLTNYSSGVSISKQFSRTGERGDFPYNPYSRSSQIKGRDRSRSPENRSYNYGPGGVLALALTCGSKAVVSQFSSSVSVTPVNPNSKRNEYHPQLTHHTPPHSSPGSPELSIDFSRRLGSVSPKHGLHSPTPSTTPRSTPGLSESAEDLSDDYHQSDRHQGPGSAKRSASSFGPRKRSSLILEKYAQETHPSPTSSPNSKESILSQRLRLSSVIQYAEKCT